MNFYRISYFVNGKHITTSNSNVALIPRIGESIKLINGVFMVIDVVYDLSFEGDIKFPMEISINLVKLERK